MKYNKCRCGNLKYYYAKVCQKCYIKYLQSNKHPSIGIKRPDLVKYNKLHPKKGIANPNYGKSATKKQRKLMSSSQKLRFSGNPKNHPAYGTHLTKEHILKLKKARSVNRPITRMGYILVWSSKNIYKRIRVLEHRFIVEKRLHRKLKSTEIVHHINSKRWDNRPSNLYLFKSKRAHALWHKLLKCQPDITLNSNLAKGKHYVR